jgi:hypothetical protein
MWLIILSMNMQNILMLFWINYGHSSLVEVNNVAKAISIRLSYILMRINKNQRGLIRTSIMKFKAKFYNKNNEMSKKTTILFLSFQED